MLKCNKSIPLWLYIAIFRYRLTEPSLLLPVNVNT